MRIYTKGGDAGQTGLFGGQRVHKHDLRVTAYGEVDELNAVLGLCRAEALPAELEAQLARVQNELFTLGAELATPEPEQARIEIPRTQPAWAEAMEPLIDAIDGEVPPLRQFILPGGTRAAAQLHVARTVCRRAERAVVELAQSTRVEPPVIAYLNRLSDWLFMAARLANHRAGLADVAWKSPLSK